MTAYTPRHAITQPRTGRLSLYRRARRVLLSLLPARKVTVSLTAEPPAPFADRFPCCGHCTDGCPCEPQDNHSAPCKDGCNDPAALRPVTLTDAEIAALKPARLTPVEYANAMHAAALPYLPRRERRPGKQPWHTMELPLIPQMRDDGDEEAAELARAGYVREQMPVMGERPQLEVLAAVKDALLTPGVAEAQRLAKAMIA
jgi:hypothetical protein